MAGWRARWTALVVVLACTPHRGRMARGSECDYPDVTNMVVALDPPRYTLPGCVENGTTSFNLSAVVDGNFRGASVTTIDISNCGLTCLAPDLFAFPGAELVETVNLQDNLFSAVPEELLWPLPKLLKLFARRSQKLITVPERFFEKSADATLVYFSGTAFAVDRLPDKLLDPLRKLEFLSFQDAEALHELPDMSSLGSLKVGYLTNLVRVQHIASSSFESLVAAKTIMLTGSSLARVPSLSKAASLKELYLDRNRIAEIKRGDFDGAVSLLLLKISGNPLVSIDPAAFLELTGLNYPAGSDGALLTDDVFGIGNSFPMSVGHFDRAGGDGVAGFTQTAIQMEPSPRQCDWVGPSMNAIDCSGCMLGYEEADNSTERCVKPTFRPWKSWSATRSKDYRAFRASISGTLLVGRTYRTGAAPLEPRQERFVGYSGDFTKIKYELDFTNGAEVDIGCGSKVLGNYANDEPVGFDTPGVHHQPYHMAEWGAQFIEHHGYVVEDGKEGLTKAIDKFPRHYRFEVTKPGDFTFETCNSQFHQAVMLFRQVPPNQSERGILYTVPVYSGDRVIKTVKTGLVPVHPSRFGDRFAAWWNSQGRYYPGGGFHTCAEGATSCPHRKITGDSLWPWSGGCGMSSNVNWTVALEKGSYIFMIMAGWPHESGFRGFYEAGLSCSNGGDTVRVDAGDPGGFTVDARTGAVTGVPKRALDGVVMNLRAVDADGPKTRADVMSWQFDVKEPPTFAIAPGWDPATMVSTGIRSTYKLGEFYEVAAPLLSRDQLFVAPAGNDFQSISYVLRMYDTKVDGTVAVEQDCPGPRCAGKFFVAQSGEMLIKFTARGRRTARLQAQDRAGAVVTVREWSFEALPADTLDPSNGPNGKDCGDGDPVDEVHFDETFSCACNATKFQGDNCDEEIPAERQANAGAVAGGLIVAFIVIALVSMVLYRRRVQHIKMRAFDFRAKCEEIILNGGLDLEIDIDKLPRELKRSHVTMVAKIGAGAFGEVWKGMLDESSVGGVPGYLVAIKTSKEVKGDGADELTKEATVMAQIDPHKNLVSLIGVVTSGPPLLLLLSFCEQGSLLSHARKAKDAGQPLGLAIKLTVAEGVALGMAHLADSHLIHRDLASRNVLIDSTGVAKVADFGLSRMMAIDQSGADVNSDGNYEEYYQSHGGAFAVRWTAPEAIETMKFTIASDVWSYGVVLLELFTDGARPYGDDVDNPAVIKLVLGGGRAKKPHACPAAAYSLMLDCWAQEPHDRPSFSDLSSRLASLLVELTDILHDSGGDAAQYPMDDHERLPDFTASGVHIGTAVSVPQEPHEYADTTTASTEGNVAIPVYKDLAAYDGVAEYADVTTASTEYKVAQDGSAVRDPNDKVGSATVALDHDAARHGGMGAQAVAGSHTVAVYGVSTETFAI